MKTKQIGYGLIALMIMLMACESPTNSPRNRDLAGTVTITPNTNVTTGTELTAAYSGTEDVTLSYQWNKDDVAISGKTGTKYTPDEAGSYTVTVSAEGYNPKTSAAVTVTASDPGSDPGTDPIIDPGTDPGNNTKTLNSISAVYDAARHPVYTSTPIDNLKNGLTVTAAYSDNTTTPIAADHYTLSGDISTVGEKTITVSCTEDGVTKTTTFTVTVNPRPSYGISLSVVTFHEASYGYGAQAAQTVTITNIGLNASGELAIAIDPATGFDLSGNTLPGIAAGGTGSFTVTPKTGLNAGVYAATITVSNTGNNISENFDISFAVNKAAGATVDAPTSLSKSYNRITLNTVTASTGQTVEYAINSSTTAPTDGWQDNTTFDGLTAETTYYFFARSVENDNYKTGTPSVSAAIATSQSGAAKVVVSYWVNEQDELAITDYTGSGDITLSPGDILVITAQGAGYENHQWYLNGVNTDEDGEAYTFSSMVVGKHTVGLFVQKGGKYYNANFAITVEEE